MRAAGLDIGSRTIKCAVIDGTEGRILSSERTDTGPDLATRGKHLRSQHAHDVLAVTGYGLALADVACGAPSVTEILAFARGAHTLYPGCRAALDVGGQDAKIIAVQAGRATAHKLNDRCAADAGRFLEITAAARHYEMDEFGPAALVGHDGVQISSVCAVLAESEVIALLRRRGRRRARYSRWKSRSISTWTILHRARRTRRRRWTAWTTSFSAMA